MSPPLPPKISPPQSPSIARDFALVRLDREDLSDWSTGDIRRKVPEPTDARDVGLAETLYMGVVKNLGLLSHLTEFYSGRKLRKIDPVVHKILSLGLYQLWFLDRIPASAAVNEAVGQTKRFGVPSAGGFVNAVLRNAVRDMESVARGDASAKTSGLKPAAGLPKVSDANHYAEVVLSHPRELFERYVKLVGTEKALELCRHDNAEPPTLVRLARGVDAEQLKQRLGPDDRDVEIARHEQEGIVVVRNARKQLFADWAKRGVAQVQDATSARTVEYLDLAPGLTVLDRCCGVGTKTIQIAELLRPATSATDEPNGPPVASAYGGSGADAPAEIVAMDPAHERIQTLNKTLRARKLTNVALAPAGWINDVPGLRNRTFDRVLIDAPCGNSGVLPRRPEARYKQTREAAASLVKLQTDILNDTASVVAPGGLLVYATCSIWKEENEDVAREFVRKHPQFEWEGDVNTLPNADESGVTYRDGGYVVRLRRKR